MNRRVRLASGDRRVHTLHMHPTNPPTAAARVLRHVAATLAYRAAKVLRDAPNDFRAKSVASSTRRPVQMVAHLADLMTWAVSLARGEFVWKAEGSDDWDVEVARFFDQLAALDRELAADTALPDGAVEKLIQGPLADAL